jgi:hypothetical protein
MTISPRSMSVKRSRRARHEQAHDVRLAGGGAARGFVGGDLAALAVVAGRALGGLLEGAQLLEALGGAEAAVGGAAREQDVGVVAVDGAALGLAVRRLGAAGRGALVGREAQPLQRVDDRRLCWDLLRAASVSWMRRMKIPPWRCAQAH